MGVLMARPPTKWAREAVWWVRLHPAEHLPRLPSRVGLVAEQGALHRLHFGPNMTICNCFASMPLKKTYFCVFQTCPCKTCFVPKLVVTLVNIVLCLSFGNRLLSF